MHSTSCGQAEIAWKSHHFAVCPVAFLLHSVMHHELCGDAAATSWDRIDHFVGIGDARIGAFRLQEYQVVC